MIVALSGLGQVESQGGSSVVDSLEHTKGAATSCDVLHTTSISDEGAPH